MSSVKPVVPTVALWTCHFYFNTCLGKWAEKMAAFQNVDKSCRRQNIKQRISFGLPRQPIPLPAPTHTSAQ